MSSSSHSGPFETCSRCGWPLWEEVCRRPRCPKNSQAALRWHAWRVRINLEAVRGDALMFTVTPPGGQWSEFDRWRYNVECFERWQVLRRRAGKYATRKVPGQRSGVVAWVPELQQRGMVHFHIVFEGRNKLERRWAEAYCRYLRQNVTGHGFGRQVARGKWGPVGQAALYVGKLAAYLSKGSGALVELWEAGDLPGRCFYVARRLTQETGCTIRMLRRRAAMFYRGLSVPLASMSAWHEYETGFMRPLSLPELASIPGVVRREVRLRAP